MSSNNEQKLPEEQDFQALVDNAQPKMEAMEQQRESLKKEWEGKLLGKKLVDKDEMKPEQTLEPEHFLTQDLHTPNRILKGDNVAMTMDYRPNRLNVKLNDDNVITEVFFV